MLSRALLLGLSLGFFVALSGHGGTVRVAEIMPGDAEVLADEDGQYPGWVELENTSELPVSLANHGLSDEIAQPFKWRFPDVLLGPGQRLIVFTSGKDRRELPVSDLAPTGSSSEWRPSSLPGLALWLDASDPESVVTAGGRVERWQDQTGRLYPTNRVPVVMPGEVPGLVLWMDAADPTTLVWAGDQVLTWRDKSGYKNHATQPSSNARVERFALADGRPPRLRFDGKDDHLRVPPITEVLTIMWVAREDSATAEYAALLGDLETMAHVPGERRALLDPVRAPDRRAWLNGAEISPYATRIPNQLVVATISGMAGAPLSLLGSDRLRVGGYWAGELGEVLLFNRWLSGPEREGLERYLIEKWQPEQAPPPTHYDAVQELRSSRPSLLSDAQTGLPAIRFDGEDDWLGFPRMEDIRTVVWVGRERPGSATGNPPVLGDQIRYDLLRGSGGKIYQYFQAAEPVRAGQTWLDGIEVDPLTTQLPERRVQLSTIATAPVTLGLVGSGRLLAGNFWGGDLHEVLLFNQPLAADDRRQLESYLASKWRLPERHLHTSFELRSSGEWLVLTDPQGRTLDALPPVSCPSGVSWVQEDRDRPAGFCLEPTPGRANTTPRAAGLTAAPVLDPPGGYLAGPASVTIRAPGDTTVYYSLDGAVPQPPLSDPTDVAWFDDGFPDTAVPGEGSLSAVWSETTPAAWSGKRALVSEAGAGVRMYSFELRTGGLAVRDGDRLFVHVRLDPQSPPRGLLLEWHAGTWDHRAFWGDRANWPGTEGRPDLLSRGDLPALGEWVRLEVPASELGLEETLVDGLAVSALDGGVLWDLAGKSTRTPTPSMRYTGPVAVVTNGVLRARAFREGDLPSPAVSATYIVGRRPELPVVSLALDPDDFSGSVRGLAATGPDASGFTPNYGANFWKPWERAVDFTFIETNGVPVFSSGAGIKIHGAWSRSAPQKSFRLYARRRYGAGGFEHRFFPALAESRFEVLVLRNGGNDWSHAKMRDDVARQCGAELGVDATASRPVVVYINGIYWGLYSLMERPDEHFIASRHDVDPEAIDVMENGWDDSHGDATAYSALMEDCARLDLAEPEAFHSVAARLDMDSILGYLATEIHLGNSDWPVHNTLLWRPRRPDGQWRWILADLDGAFDINGGGAERPTLRIALGLAPGEVTGLLQPAAFLPPMLANSRFRQDFINHFADALNAEFAPEKLVARIDALEAAMVTEMPWHLARWRDSASANWPLPKTPEAWAAEVERLHRFARERPAEMRRQLVEQFQLGGEARLTVRVNDPTLGRVRVNRLRLAAGDASWSGIYFQGVPIELEALPEAGCEWVAWQGLQNAPALVRVTPADDLDVRAEFRRSADPAPAATRFELWQGDYRFESFPAGTPAGEYPPCMMFLQSASPDPGLDAHFETPWFLSYDLASRSRVSGRGARGVSFLNTGNPQDVPGAGFVGAAVLSLRTEGVRNIRVAWVGGTVTPNPRSYGLRLQYRVGTEAGFVDVMDEAGQPVQYHRSPLAGEWQRLGPVRLPAEAEDQPVVQLRWVYHRVPGSEDSGARDELRLDDILVSGERSPTLRLRPGSAVGVWIAEISGAFAPGGWLQASSDFVTWRNEAEITGSLDGRETIRLSLNPDQHGHFFRLWIP